MVGPDRMGAWIDQMAREHQKSTGHMTVENAKNMLALCACIEKVAVAVLIKYELENT